MVQRFWKNSNLDNYMGCVLNIHLLFCRYVLRGHSSGQTHRYSKVLPCNIYSSVCNSYHAYTFYLAELVERNIRTNQPYAHGDGFYYESNTVAFKSKSCQSDTYPC